MLHHLNADVPGVLVGQQRVGVVNHSGDYAAEDGKAKFGRQQPPKSGWNRLVRVQMTIQNVNDQFRNVTQGDRKQRRNYASDDSKCHHSGAGIPHDFQDRRHVAQGRETLPPTAPEVFFL